MAFGDRAKRLVSGIEAGAESLGISNGKWDLSGKVVLPTVEVEHSADPSSLYVPGAVALLVLLGVALLVRR